MNESKAQPAGVEENFSPLQIQRLPVYPGLDLLRLIAMVIVTLQHATVAATSIEWTRLWGTSLGQYGVNIFCAISGFLAFQDHRTAGDWLQRRLMRLYPAYWLIVLFGFAANALLKYKPVSFQLFVFQLAGLGGFLHADIVNIAVWFISLILLCYGLTFIARLSRYPFVIMAIFTSLFAYLTLQPNGFKHPHAHVLSFCLAGLIGFFPQRVQRILVTVVCVIAIPFISFVPTTAYVAFTFFLMALALQMTNVMERVHGLAGSTYEYFLIHGMCFAAIGRYLRGSWWLMAIGLLLAFATSCYGAVVLRIIATKLEKILMHATSMVKQIILPKLS